MSAAAVFQQMLVIFILISVGYGLSRGGRLSEAASKQMAGLVTNFCNPAIMITGALGADGAGHKEVLLTAGLAAASYALLILLGALLPGLMGVPKGQRAFYHMMLVYGNTGFIGIPVVSAVLGQEALIYVTIYTLFFNLLIYTHGAAVMARAGGGSRRKGGRGIAGLINPGTVCGVLAVILYWWQIPLPKILEESLSYMAQCVTFLSMVILGVSLAGFRMRELFTEPGLYLLTAVRMLAVPILLTLVMKRFVADPLILGTFALIQAMPVANLPLMMAKQADLECGILAKGILLTTLFSVVTIPIVAAFL